MKSCNKIQYAIARKETGNASGKAKKDAYDIALRLGFTPSYEPSSRQIVRIIQQIATLYKFIGRKIVFFQYPAVSEQLMKLFSKAVSDKSYKIALVHDLSSIQGLANYEKEREIKLLSIFDCIIVHNGKMEEYVKKMGYQGKVVILELFDYLHNAKHSIVDMPFSNTISFAGNLGKARFLQNLGEISNCNWILYGITGDAVFTNISNIIYKGILPSDEIQYLMEGDYGLVWDGDSIKSCSGLSGDYLRYNNPHKLSCCIAAGKPIITWKQAAISGFVQKNKIGIVVESLEELKKIDLENGYYEMKENVMRIKNEIAEGKYLERAILKAIDLMR